MGKGRQGCLALTTFFVGPARFEQNRGMPCGSGDWNDYRASVVECYL